MTKSRSITVVKKASDNHTITVYKAPSGYRIVYGTDNIDANNSPHTVYPSTAVAYAAEYNPDIRRAILRIDPNADCHDNEAAAVRATLEAFFSAEGFNHIGFIEEMTRRAERKLTREELRDLGTLVAAYEKERSQAVVS